MEKNIKKEINYPVFLIFLVALNLIQGIILYQGNYVSKIRDTKNKTILQVELENALSKIERLEKNLDDSMYLRNQQLKAISNTLNSEMRHRNQQLTHIQHGVHKLNGLFGIKCDKTGKVPYVEVYNPNVKYMGEN